MLVVRFKVRCRPEHAGQVAAALETVVAPAGDAAIYRLSSTEGFGSSN